MTSVKRILNILLPNQPYSKLLIPPEREGLCDGNIVIIFQRMDQCWAIDFRILWEDFYGQFSQVGVSVLINTDFHIIWDVYFWSDYIKHYYYIHINHKQNNVMFNPKQALERIRRTKHQKQQVKSITSGVQPLFSSTQPPEKKPAQVKSSNIEDRVNKLELMVMRLTEQLSTSNEAVQKLKRQNSNLETQVLKLEYENSQLKMSQIYSGVRRSGSNKKITQPINQEPEKQKQLSLQKPKKIEKQQSQYSSEKEVRDKYSIQVQQIIEDIKNQPLENVLKRRQYQFRARKPDQKQISMGNKYLKELAAIQKDYGKTMKKPVLVIKLDDADFE